MPIQILSAQLANQIAAGEVVERPASVVKELVENSLDSGASSIEIEIEKGGHKRIVIRDNGCGIVHEELALALSRHATSKISCLDDLEAICSLGFRGEALASISSVSRLTLSSKPKEQQQAWQAHCEGRDMQVQVNPVAHPDGTSIDVADLFFNTPARRKFLKTEKTEFTHIDEVIRRIALSRFDVAFSLKHNGKLLRKYPAINNQAQQIKRVAAICGKDFSEQGIALNSQYQNFEIKGWLLPPEHAQNSAVFQYFYVNGRVMRDKLINHAIRQAMEEMAGADCPLSYVLYLSVEANQLDVNVHPAKHEVRFHQARLVHDFIYRALMDGFKQNIEEQYVTSPEAHILAPVEPKHDYIQPLQPINDAAPVVTEKNYGYDRSKAPAFNQYAGGASAHTAKQHQVDRTNVQTAAFSRYTELMTADVKPAPLSHNPEMVRWLRIDKSNLLLSFAEAHYVLAVKRLHMAVLNNMYQDQSPVSQPLLMPVSIDADPTILKRAKAISSALLESSVEIGWTNNRIILRKVPAGLRQFRWIDCLANILGCKEIRAQEVRKHLLTSLSEQADDFDDGQVNQLWERFINQSTDLEAQIKSHARLVPLTKWIAEYE